MIDDKDGCALAFNLLKRAVLTNDSLPDGHPAITSWPEILRDHREAYGYESAKVRRFQPTAKDMTNFLPAMAWLCWLKEQNNGPRDFKILTARFRGLSMWKIAQWHGRSERTIVRWSDGAVAAIYSKFKEEVWGIANV